MQPDHSDHRAGRTAHPVIVSVGIVLVLGAAVGTAYIATRDDSERTSTTVASGTQSHSSSSQSSVTGPYTDSTYTATGSYETPGGTESIEVTLTLADGTVQSVNAVGSASGGDAGEYQSQFLASYEPMVVGKSINDISLSRVAGSSLTSNGFNQAIEEIKRDAVS